MTPFYVSMDENSMLDDHRREKRSGGKKGTVLAGAVEDRRGI